MSENIPAAPTKKELQEQELHAHLRSLDGLAERVEKLEKIVAALEAARRK